ncbi:MAG: polyhydroxyalkanoate synthesis regulator DNA-binding domain-containing protein [Actinomycetota bacterium]
MAELVRVIKRYANRKLYDSGSGQLTSLRRIEELVREGVDIQVVDHDTGEDTTSEVLAGLLSNSIGDGTIEGDTPLLMSLIRIPNDLLTAALKNEQQRSKELRAMGQRVRLLSATIDALLGQLDHAGAEESAAAPPPKSPGRRRAGQPPTRRS